MSTKWRTRVAVWAALLAATAAAFAACGSGGSVDGGTVPTRPATTASPTGGTGTTEPGSPATTTEPTATTEVTLYLTQGEKIVPVRRAVPKVAGIGAETMKALVGGPTAAQSDHGLGTAIPIDTHFRALTITDGVAKVDFSKDFESGGGSLSLSLRLAQVTCTLDQFDSISGVRFLLDGEVVNVFSGNGIVLDKPVSCADYAEYVGDETVLPPMTGTFPGIWPYWSQAQVDDRDPKDETSSDLTNTAKGFGALYLGMVNPAVLGSPTPADGGRMEVQLGFTVGEGGAPIVDPQPTVSVFLIRVDAPGDHDPWTVVAATSPQIVVSAPLALDRVSSPVSARGAAATFEGNVEVQVRADGMPKDKYLGRGQVTGRGDGVLGDFTGEIPFDPPAQPAGAIVFLERSSADGQGVLRATVVRVAFAS